jgi:hypothetical protein
MNENRTTISNANMEPNTGNAPVAEEEAKGSNPPYDIHVHSIRKRLADVDGISAKAAIDGLVKAGILADDSATYVKSIRFTQEKGSEEKTIIEII